MAKITGKRIYGNLVCKILLTVAVFWGVLIAARLPSTIYDSFFRYKDLVGLAAVGFVSHMVLANFQKKAFVCWLLMLLFYGTPAYLKLRVGIPLTMDEVTDTYCFATILLYIAWFRIFALWQDSLSQIENSSKDHPAACSFSDSIVSLAADRILFYEWAFNDHQYRADDFPNQSP